MHIELTCFMTATRRLITTNKWDLRLVTVAGAIEFKGFPEHGCLFLTYDEPKC